jgi:polysaccharide export outer membrane protein
MRTAAAEGPPQLRYSVEADGPPPAQSLPPNTPRYSAGVAPAPPPPPAPQDAQAPDQQVASIAPQMETVTVTGYRGYQLGAGDKVHITVYGEADLTGDFEVSGAGRIAFPLIGEVQAAGLTAPELGQRLGELLGNGYLISPHVAVEVSSYRPFYVVGEVNRPGSFPYTDGMTALNAIALAGGFTPGASEGDVYIRHAGQTKEVEMPIDDVTRIEPGDVVRVDESTFWGFMRILSPLTAAAANARYGIP